jgi:hypothetical protein
MIEITAIRVEGGAGHEHITDVLWRSAATALGQSPRQAIIDWLMVSDQNQAVVVDGSAEIHTVAVVLGPDRPAYLRTRANGVWTDDLLSLPRF